MLFGLAPVTIIFGAQYHEQTPKSFLRMSRHGQREMVEDLTSPEMLDLTLHPMFVSHDSQPPLGAVLGASPETSESQFHDIDIYDMPNHTTEGTKQGGMYSSVVSGESGIFI